MKMLIKKWTNIKLLGILSLTCLVVILGNTISNASIITNCLTSNHTYTTSNSGSTSGYTGTSDYSYSEGGTNTQSGNGNIDCISTDSSALLVPAIPYVSLDQKTIVLRLPYNYDYGNQHPIFMGGISLSYLANGTPSIDANGLPTDLLQYTAEPLGSLYNQTAGINVDYNGEPDGAYEICYHEVDENGVTFPNQFPCIPFYIKGGLITLDLPIDNSNNTPMNASQTQFYEIAIWVIIFWSVIYLFKIFK